MRIDLHEDSAAAPLQAFDLAENPLASDGQKRKRKVRIKPKHIAVAKAYASGKSLRQSFLSAGYSESSSRAPSAILANTPALVAAIKSELQHFNTTPAARTALIRQRLVKAILTAKHSDAIRACEVAGKDREINLWTPDNVTGVFINTSSDTKALLSDASALLAPVETSVKPAESSE